MGMVGKGQDSAGGGAAPIGFCCKQVQRYFPILFLEGGGGKTRRTLKGPQRLIIVENYTLHFTDVI